MSNKIKIILGVCLLSGLVFAASITKFYGDIDMQSHKITNLATPTSNNDATTKSYVDTQVSSSAITKLSLTGGTMLGNINMDGRKITNVRTPVSSADVATKSYVDNIAIIGSLPSLAVKYGGSYPPIINLNSNTNGSLSVKVINQFASGITFTTENTSLVADQTFSSKIWKVGENIKVNYGIGAGEYSATNGTLIAKDDGGAVLGRWGITFPPTAYPSFKVFVHDELVNGNTSLALQNSFFDGSKNVDFGITNISAVSGTATLVLPKALFYVNDNERSTTITPISESPYSAPTTISLSVPAKQCKWFKANFGIDPEVGGVRWQFDIATSGSTNRFGQFYLWAN